MELSEKIEKVISNEVEKNKELSKQLEFLKSAQQSGVIKKPEYNLASIVNVVSPA